jgi:hypothetical protein
VVQKEDMKILRAVLRRGSSVEPAGYYSLLKANTWFPASRLPVPFGFRGSKSAATTTLKDSGSPEAALPPKIAPLSAERPRLLRLATIVLAAIAVIFVMLWWIMSEAPPNSY